MMYSRLLILVSATCLFIGLFWEFVVTTNMQLPAEHTRITAELNDMGYQTISYPHYLMRHVLWVIFGRFVV